MLADLQVRNCWPCVTIAFQSNSPNDYKLSSLLFRESTLLIYWVWWQYTYLYFIYLYLNTFLIQIPLTLQKWSKGKVRDKLNNQVLFDKATYDKLYKEVPQYKLITPAVVSERLKVRGSLARRALIELREKGEILKIL